MSLDFLFLYKKPYFQNQYELNRNYISLFKKINALNLERNLKVFPRHEVEETYF